MDVIARESMLLEKTHDIMIFFPDTSEEIDKLRFYYLGNVIKLYIHINMFARAH